MPIETARSRVKGRLCALVLRPWTRTRGRKILHFRDQELKLEEAVNLAAAIDLEVAAAEAFEVTRPSPATLLGKGRVEQTAARIVPERIGLVVIDAPLSPVQQRNLETAWKAKVIDRTGLILEIFGQRARTREGRLQVELAHLLYQKTRLVRSWTHLERQRGGFGFLGGPGERQIEADRRQLEERIRRIQSDLADVAKRRAVQRKARARVPYPVVALAGYTNAGKSSLFNRLTGAAVEAIDKLFATLDPTLRALKLPSGRKIILSDTVGFISDLPTQLVAAFRATLEEVLQANLILHVRDVANPETEAQREDVLKVLGSLGIETGATPIIECLNKLDLLPGERAEAVRTATARKSGAVAVSALTGEGTAALLEVIDGHFAAWEVPARIVVPSADGAAQAWLHAHAHVLKKTPGRKAVAFEVRIAAKPLGQFKKEFPAARVDEPKEKIRLYA
jgi:GTPase